MLIKITKTHHRALDPRTTKTFYINEVLDFEENLAQDIIKNDFGVEHKELKQEIENKAILQLPETKQEIAKDLEVIMADEKEVIWNPAAVIEEEKALEEAKESLEQNSKEEFEESSIKKPAGRKPKDK